MAQRFTEIQTRKQKVVPKTTLLFCSMKNSELVCIFWKNSGVYSIF